jgi:DNA-binding GntR family transcriptional regulator
VADQELDLIIERPEETIPARVVRVVRQAILDGALPPGRRLTERELVDLTGVSRTSIREAIRHLQNLGLVEPTSGRGVRVVLLSSDDVRYIYELRDALEPAAAELFVLHATDAEVAELLDCLPPVDADPEERLRLIYRFDRLLAAGTHNPLLRDVLDPLYARIHPLRRLSTSIEGRQEASTQEFEELAAAIGARSPERAARAAHQHVRAAMQAALVAVGRLESQNQETQESQRREPPRRPAEATGGMSR